MKKEKRWLPHFRRSLVYLWPQRRRIILGMLCAIGVAMTYSAGVFAILPILKVLISDEGPRTAVFRMLAEERLSVTFSGIDYRKDRIGPDVPVGAMIVRDIGAGSPLLGGEAGVHIGDAIFLPADQADNPDEMIETMGMAPVDMPLELMCAAGGSAPRRVSVSVRPVPFYYEWAGNLAARLPLESTPDGQINTLITFLVIIFCINVVGNVCKFWTTYLITISAARAMMDLRRHMFSRVLNMHMAWFSTHLSETMSRIVRDIQDVMRGYSAVFGKIMTEPLKALAVFVIAVAYDYRLTVMVVLGVPIGVVVLRYASRKIRRANQRLLAGYAKLVEMLNSTLLGMRVIRAYTREGYERKRMWDIERRMFRQMKKIARAEAMASPALEVLGVALAMVGVVWFARQTVEGTLRPEEFIQTIVLLGFMFDPIRKVSVANPRLAKADSGAARVFQLIDLPEEQKMGLWLEKLPPLREQIEFRKVTFRYPDTTAPALEDINFTIQAGENVAIVGPNGSGKTTLISLFLRFFDPTAGSILIDGKDIRRVSLKSLREQVSLITQDAVVFPLTARENIAYGRLEASEEELLDAARAARADEFIEHLPEGYDTTIGEFGETLSGGECQRMCLARAILRNAPIFIFDEATSQVDVDSEKKIRDALIEFMKGRTSLIIAHRIATIQQADKIVVLDRGRIVDIGKHAELLERCELYKTLYYTHLHGNMDDVTKTTESSAATS